MIRKLNENEYTTDLELYEELCMVIYNNGFDMQDKRELYSLALEVLDDNGDGSYVDIKSNQTRLIYRLAYSTLVPGHFLIDPPCKFALGEKSIFKDVKSLESLLKELSALNL